MGDEPYIVFDRRKPESYWDDFAVDLGVMFPAAPLLLAVGLGLALLAGRGRGVWHPPWTRPPGPERHPGSCRLAHPGAGDRLVRQGDPGLPRRLFRPLGRSSGLLHKVKVAECAAGDAGSTAWHDRRPWRSGADLVQETS